MKIDNGSFVCWTSGAALSSLVAMATDSGTSRCPADRTGSERAGSARQFVVQADNKRAELAEAHEVAADDVDSAVLRSRPLLARPAEQQ